MVYGDELLDGLALCLEYYRELQNTNPKHELLKFGDVKPEDKGYEFYIAENHRGEFNKRFGKEGLNPIGHRACTYAIAHYASALIKATKTKEESKESELVKKTEQTQDSSDIPF